MLDTCTRWKRLLNLCKSTNIRIYNGRLKEDKDAGEFTFINNNTATVIEYVLISRNDFEHISTFGIQSPNVFSDYCAIHLC